MEIPKKNLRVRTETQHIVYVCFVYGTEKYEEPNMKNLLKRYHEAKANVKKKKYTRKDIKI